MGHSELNLSAHPEIPWVGIIGLRNVPTHEYGEVLMERIWLAACDPFPPSTQGGEGQLYFDVTFSGPMGTASVPASFSICPDVPGFFSGEPTWSENNTNMHYQGKVGDASAQLIRWWIRSAAECMGGFQGGFTLSFAVRDPTRALRERPLKLAPCRGVAYTGPQRQ
jgi:hypothetical protein